LIAGFIYSVLAALGDLFGGAIVLRSPPPRRALGILTGFGAGFMLAVALVGMLPEAIATHGGMTAILIGYMIVHLTQHTLTPHFHFGEETHADEMVSRGVGVWALIGLLPHSFFDGVAISSGFLTSRSLGMLVFFGILLHKIPTGVSLASVMLASGNTRGRALIAVIAMGVATILGGIITPAITPLVHYGLPLAAGVTIYVAASNLIPESQREHDHLVQYAVFAGVLAFYVIQLFIGHAH
jgi:ZIP family zinc transporter/zinc and cadmium transporter